MIDHFALTHVGKVRKENQDAICYEKKENGYLAIVADGMGGYQGGAFASRRAVQLFREQIHANWEIVTPEMAKQILQKISRSLWQTAEEDPNKKDMGTTFTAAIVRGENLLVVHVGDSRAYLLEKGTLRQITKDHSYMRFLLDHGLLKEEECVTFPYPNVITQAVGMKELEVDAFCLPLPKEYSLLLCSDGLTHGVSNEKISHCMKKKEPAKERAEALLQMALDAGGNDNISIILAEKKETIVLNGNYELGEKIAEGGMSHVYRVWSRKARKFMVAKILKEELAADIRYVRAFRTEAFATMRLHHKNIVKTVDVGTDRGLKYIIMEEIKGESLQTQIAKKGAFLPESCVAIGMTLAKALGYAHQKKIIHKDLKTANIIITPEGEPVIIDFGIAEEVSKKEQENQEEVFGSVCYFSPEQAKGESVDHRTDLYSLGVILYEMTTGHLPFSGENPVDIALKHLHQTPVPPKELRPEIPESLNRVILRALRKDREDRYDYADDMSKDLAKVFHQPDGRYVKFWEEGNEIDRRRSLKKRQRRLRITAVTLLSTFVAFVGLMVLFLNIIVQPEKTYYMPLLTDFNEEEALDILKEMGVAVKVNYVSSALKNGQVVSQLPEYGAKLEPGDAVQISVSRSGNDNVIPNLEGMHIKDALLLLHERGLNSPLLFWESDASEEDGIILKQTPPENETISDGEKIELTVNRTIKKEKAPDVVGNTLGAAVEKCTEAGYAPIFVDCVQNETTHNMIIRQDSLEGENSKGMIRLQTSFLTKRNWEGRIPIGDISLHHVGNLIITMPQTIEGNACELIVFEETISSLSAFYETYQDGIPIDLYGMEESISTLSEKVALYYYLDYELAGSAYGLLKEEAS